MMPSHFLRVAQGLSLVFLLACASFACAADLTKADRDSLLAQRAGFGHEVSGGYDGPVVHVTTDADSGEGSLRDAVKGDEPRWVVFDGDCTIHLSKGIEVGSNKTIDGRGRKVTLTGHNQYGLMIGGENVIVENLILHDFGDIEKTKSNDPYDAIHIGSIGKAGQAERKVSDRVWIDHCDLSMAGDKLISIAATTNVTVSWNRFHDQQQVFQIGSMSGQELDASTTVTSHHNYFHQTGYRHPVISYGKLHAYNNYIFDWQLYGIRAERTAEAYLECNIFEAGDKKKATHTKPGGNGTNDAHTLQDTRPGYLKSVGDLKLNKAKIQESEPGKVFDPSKFYSYKAETATPELAKRIAAQAGWQPAAFFGLKPAATAK